MKLIIGNLYKSRKRIFCSMIAPYTKIDANDNLMLLSIHRDKNIRCYNFLLCGKIIVLGLSRDPVEDWIEEIINENKV